MCAWWASWGKMRLAETLEAFLHQEALNLDDLTFSPNAPTGTATSSVVDERGENTIVVIPGANHDLHPSHLSHLPIHEGDFCLSPSLKSL
jgi:sugar/nucleoside kinase (ribokinase family)